MRTFKVTLEYGINVDDKVDYIETEDDATDEEIEEECKDIAFNEISWSYEEIK